MKGLICVPHTGSFPYQFVVAWTQLVQHTANICPVDLRYIGSCLIYEAREQAVEFMTENGHDWIFFLDSDMVPDADVIEKLLARNVPIASAMAFKRTQPYQPCFYPSIKFNGKEAEVEIPKTWEQGLFEVDGVGMACCLIRREVFENTPRPWFFPIPVLAEDLGFCMRAREAGYPAYIDTTLCVGHVGTEVITDKHYQAYRQATGG